MALIGLVCLLGHSALAQPAPTDTAQARMILNKAKAFMEAARYDSADALLKGLKAYGERAHSPSWTACAQHDQGVIFRRPGRYPEAQDGFRTVLKSYVEAEIRA